MQRRAGSTATASRSPVPAVDPRNTTRRVRIAARSLQALGRLPGYRGRGLSAAGRILSKLCRDDELVLFITADARLSIQLSDAYWVRLLVFGEQYEPEVMSILSLIPHAVQDVLFVDCGANCGYWSALCSGKPFSWRCVALEPSPATMTLLERTRVLNGGRFELEQAAVWETDGVNLPFHESPESSASHLTTEALAKNINVTSVITTTLDSIIGRHGREPDVVIIKLDVEGAEINAFHGAREALAKRNALFVYEDHGEDPACRVTQFVLDELKLTVLYASDDGTIEHIRSVDSARSVKTNPNKGYNFVALSRDGAFSQLILSAAEVDG